MSSTTLVKHLTTYKEMGTPKLLVIECERILRSMCLRLWRCVTSNKVKANRNKLVKELRQLYTAIFGASAVTLKDKYLGTIADTVIGSVLKSRLYQGFTTSLVYNDATIAFLVKYLREQFLVRTKYLVKDKVLSFIVPVRKHCITQVQVNGTYMSGIAVDTAILLDVIEAVYSMESTAVPSDKKRKLSD